MMREFGRCSALMLLSVAALAAGAPARAADSPPDLSGVWWLDGGAKPALQGLAAARQKLSAQGRARFVETKAEKASIDAKVKDLTDVRKCVPPGVTRLWGLPFPFEIVAKPDVTVLLFEHTHSLRFAYMNQPRVDPEQAVSLNRLGSSVGRWEGDTLVIETTAFSNLGFLDEEGLPQGEKLETVERIRPIGPNKLSISIEVKDPEFYSEPWTLNVTATRRPGSTIEEYVCGYGVLETRYTK